MLNGGGGCAHHWALLALGPRENQCLSLLTHTASFNLMDAQGVRRFSFPLGHTDTRGRRKWSASVTPVPTALFGLVYISWSWLGSPFDFADTTLVRDWDHHLLLLGGEWKFSFCLPLLTPWGVRFPLMQNWMNFAKRIFCFVRPPFAPSFGSGNRFCWCLFCLCLLVLLCWRLLITVSFQEYIGSNKKTQRTAVLFQSQGP